MAHADPVIYRLHQGGGPVLATAIHDGHLIRPSLLPFVGLSDQDRLREEDPFTGIWTEVAGTRVVATRSRFEVDLNRPRESCTYRVPADCWGLELYAEAPPHEMFAQSVAQYDQFYGEMHALLTAMIREHNRVVVYDLHSYNHRRAGPNGPAADGHSNPQVNVGTGTMNRERWGSVVDAFLGALRAHAFPGGRLDVRENIKFRGGNWARWVHTQFPSSAVVLSIEFKKFFMDEWSGQPIGTQVDDIRRALQATVQPVLTALADT